MSSHKPKPRKKLRNPLQIQNKFSPDEIIQSISHVSNDKETNTWYTIQPMFSKSTKAGTATDEECLKSHLQVSNLKETETLYSAKLVSKPVSDPGTITENPKIQDRIGAYKIIEEVATGGMGKIYKAYHPQLKRFVAIKVLINLGNASQEERQRLLKEAQLIAKLKHPNIIAVHDIGIDKGIDFIVMDFIEGSDFLDYLRNPQIPPRFHLKVLKEVALAIEYAHQQNIIHRDLKPTNIMIEENRQAPVIMDFGLGKNTLDRKITRNKIPLGTPKYMSPEQAEVGREVTYKSDIYALGAILYESLTGTTPFLGDNPSEILDKIIHQEIVAPRRKNSKVSKNLEAICMKALDKNPDRRYSSAKDFAEDLERYMNGENVQATILKSPKNSTFKNYWSLRSRVFIATVILFSMIVLGVLTMELYDANKHRTWVDNIGDKLQIVSTTLPADPKNLEYWNQPKNLYQIEATIQRFIEIRWQVETLLKYYPKSDKGRLYLFEIERSIGFLANCAGNYTLSEICFQRCKNLGWQQQGQEYLNMLYNNKFAMQERYHKEISNYMREISLEKRSLALEKYSAKILMIPRAYVLKNVVFYLKSRDLWQRLLAVRIIKNLSDVASRVDGKDSAQWLLEALGKVDLEWNSEEACEIIWALGYLQDSRANSLIEKVRSKWGKDSSWWQKTQEPYLWIPMETIKPKNVEDFLSLARKYLNKGKYHEAMNTLTQTIEKFPQTTEAYCLRGGIYIEIRDFASAAKDARQIITLEPNSAKGHLYLAVVFQNQQQFLQAIESINRAIYLEPNNAKLYQYLAEISAQQQLLDGAIINYTRAIQLQSQNAQLYVQRAGVFVIQQKITEAIDDLNYAILLDPHYVSAHIYRGNIYLNQKFIEKAIVDFTHAITLDANRYEAFLGRAQCYESQNKLKSALHDYNQTIQLQTENPRLYLMRAKVYNELQQSQNAIKDLQMAWKWHHKDITICKPLADLYNKIQQYHLALKCIQRYLKLFPQDEEGHRIFRYAKSHL